MLGYALCCITAIIMLKSGRFRNSAEIKKTSRKGNKMVRGGYRGKILRVDLTTGNIRTEEIPDESILRKYVGCFGLGLWYLFQELPSGVGALEPENPLIFMNGPLVSVRVPCPNNCTLTTLNGDTQFTAGRSHTHGWFQPSLQKAGHEGLPIFGG